MKLKRARGLAVAAFIGGGIVLFGVSGCGPVAKPTMSDTPSPAIQAAAEPAGASEAAEAATPTNEAAPVAPPMAQPPAGVQTAAAPAENAAQAETTYTVRKGDTLSGISRHYYGTPAKWRTIFEANRNVLKSSNVLKPGMKLVIPALKAAEPASSTGATQSP